MIKRVKPKRSPKKKPERPAPLKSTAAAVELETVDPKAVRKMVSKKPRRAK